MHIHLQVASLSPDVLTKNLFSQGHVESAELLLKKYGAKTECKNMDGLTPLMCAVQQGHIKIASLLLAADPTRSQTCISPSSPLSFFTAQRCRASALVTQHEGENTSVRESRPDLVRSTTFGFRVF